MEDRTQVIEQLVAVTGDESWWDTSADLWELQFALAMLREEPEMQVSLALA